jgi:hypothetical protein
LAMVKLMTIQATRLPLKHKIDMIYPEKPVRTEGLFEVQKEEFLITWYMCEMYTRRKAKRIHKRQTHLLVREDVT